MESTQSTAAISVSQQLGDKVLLLEKFRNIKVFERGGKRAVHKPLLILLALRNIQNGGNGQLMFLDVRDELAALINQFSNNPNGRPRPHYPFWYLRSDGFWSLQHTEELASYTGEGRSAEPPIGQFNRLNPKGGFNRGLTNLLKADKNFFQTITNLVLESAFPETRQQDVIDTIGLDLIGKIRQERNPQFRRDILREYNYICAVCEFDGRLGGTPIGIEAAHIRMFSHKGPDKVQNGLALCSLHHKLFDAGAFTIDSGYHVIVSRFFSGLSNAAQHLVRINKIIQLPVREESWPDQTYLAWHQKNLFVE